MGRGVEKREKKVGWKKIVGFVGLQGVATWDFRDFRDGNGL
jgi:hypothetical protein